MKRKIVITISREYGSGGKLLAQQLAKELSIPYYDKEILLSMVKESGIQEGLLQRIDEQVRIDGYYFKLTSSRMMSTTGTLGELSILEKIYDAQQQVIKEIASDSCVILGRCSGAILKNDPDAIHVFVRGDIEDKKKRAVEEYGEEQENIEKTLVEMDKRRSNYYNYFSNQRWGKISNYDIVINTTKSGIMGAAKVIKTYIEGRDNHG